MTINPVQQIQIDRLRLGSFNSFDGELVANSLIKNEHLWEAFVFARLKYGELIELRDISSDCLNADTIYLLCKAEAVPLLEHLARKEWKCDEFGYIDSQDRSVGSFDFRKDFSSAFGGGLKNDQVCVRIWWD